MGIELTMTEMRLIRSLLSVKTDSELANLVGKPVNIVTEYIDSYSFNPIRPTRKEVGYNKMPGLKRKPELGPAINGKELAQERAAERKRIREQKIILKRKEEERNAIRAKALLAEQNRTNARKKRIEAAKLPTRKIDLTGTIAVKLDSKTTVWVKPGTDIDALKKQYKIK